MDSLKVKFSVDGGTSIDKGTGKAIKDDLVNICSQITSSGVLKVAVQLDDSSQKTLEKQIVNAIKPDVTKSIKLRFGIDTSYLNNQLKQYYSAYQAPSPAVTTPKHWASSARAELKEVLRLKSELKSIDKDSSRGQALQEELQLHQKNLAAYAKQIHGMQDKVQQQEIINDLKRESLAITTKLGTKEASNDEKQGMNVYKQALAEQKKLAELRYKLSGVSDGDSDLKSAYQAEIDYHERLLNGYKAEIAWMGKKANSQKLLNDLKDKEVELGLSYATKGATRRSESQDVLKLVGVYKEAVVYMERYGNALKANSPELHSSLSNLINQLQKGNYSGGFKAAEAELKRIQATATKTGASVETLGQRLRRIFGDKYVYGVLAATAELARRAIGQIYRNVVDLDSAMTELKKVTNETDAAYDHFLTTATSRAKELGAALTDVVTATADFARLGYTMSDASVLADTAIVYKNVGDGIEDISTASQSIISTMQAFGIETSAAMSIVDKFNATGNNFAISSAGVGDALRRSASALAAANNDIDQSIALITAANQVVQDPDSVGTAMKTISMYLRAAKTDAEAAGESTEGMASSISELRKESLALTGNRVDVMIDENTFKSTYDILKELSAVWSSLSDVSQANVLELIGGKRNSNVISALLNNFSTAEEVLATVADSAGSALEENEKYLESIQGRISVLTASFQALSSAVLDSGLVKGAVSTLTIAVDALTAIQNSFGLETFLALGASIKGVTTDLKHHGYALGDVITMWKEFGAKETLGAFSGTLSLPTKIGLVTTALTALYSVADSIVKATTGQSIWAWFSDASGAHLANAQKHLDKARELAEEVQSLNDELIENNHRILELERLQESGSISFVDQQELENLKQANFQLASAIEHRERLLSLEQQESDSDIKKSFDRLEFTANRSAETALRSSINSVVNENLQKIAEIEATRVASLENQNAIEILREENRQLAMQANSIGGTTYSLEEYFNLLKSGYDVLNQKKQNGIALTEDEREAYEQLENDFSSLYDNIYSNFYSKASGPDKQFYEEWLTRIDMVVKPVDTLTAKFEELDSTVIDSLKSEARAGALTADVVSDLASNNAELNRVMLETGVTSEQVAAHFNALANGYSSANQTANSLVDSLSSVYKEVSQLSKFGTSVDLFNRQKIDVTEANLDIIRSWGDTETQIGDFMTVASQTYRDGDTAVVVTPILPNGQILSQKAMDAYFDQLRLGRNYEDNDSLNLVLGVFDEGSWAKNLAKSNEFSASLHNSHEEIASIIDELKALPTFIPDSAYIPDFLSAYEKKDSIDGFISDIQEEMNNTGSVSISTIKTLTETVDDYTKYLTFEGGQLGINTDLLKENADAIINNAIANLQAQKIERQIAKEKLGSSPSSKQAVEAINADLTRIEQALQFLENTPSLDFNLTGFDALQEVLKDSKTDLEQVQDIIDKFSSEGFESLSVDDFQNLVDVLPGVRSEMLLVMEAAKNGNLTFEEQDRILKKLKASADNLQKTQLAESLEDVAKAAEDYGKDSQQVQEAMDNLARICPEVADALWDAERGMYDLSGATGTTVQSIRDFIVLSLSNTVAAMKADLQSLAGQAIATAGSISFLNAQIAASTGKKYGSIGPDASANMAAGEMDSVNSQAASLNASLAAYNEVLAMFKNLSFSGGGGGGGSSSTQVDKFKEAFDAMTASIENQIQVQEQLFAQAERSLNSEEMRKALMLQVGYYQVIQREAQTALDNIRAYYRSQGLGDSEIELKEEVQDLKDTLNDATQDVQDALDRMSQAIVDAYSKALDEVQSVYKTLHDAADEFAASGFITVDTFQAILSNGVEYLTLLQNENGELLINEENIKKVIAARTEQMAVESALAYVESLRTAKKMGQEDDLNRLLGLTVETTNATWGLVYAALSLAGLEENQYNQALNVIDAIRGLAKSAADSVGKSTDSSLDELKKMQKGVNDILDAVMDMMKDNVERQIEDLEDMKDEFSEYIDMRKEALELAKDEMDYDEEKAELLKQLSALQTKIDALDLVGTRESEAQKAALLEEQQKLQKELADLQGDYAYDAQVDALDKMNEAFSESKDQEIDDLEKTISSEQKVYNMAIDYIKQNWNNLIDQLTEWNFEYGNSLESELREAWEGAYEAANKYGDYVTALGSIDADIENMGTSSNIKLPSSNQDHTATNEEYVRYIVSKMKTNSAMWATLSQDEKDRVREETQNMGDSLINYGVNAIYDPQTGVWYIDRIGGQRLYDVYHTGGIVGGGSIKQNEQYALLEKGEAVLTEKKLNKLGEHFKVLGRLGDMMATFATSLSSSLSSGFSRLTDITSNVSNVTNDNRDNRKVEITYGDTYITGANEATIKRHQEINKGFMDELARQLGVKW